MEISSAPFLDGLKLLKAIVIDPAGGKTGGSPLSFLHPVKAGDSNEIIISKEINLFICFQFD
jgi:hypothetical protein